MKGRSVTSASPTRSVAYLRVSTERQGESGLGLEAQKQAVGEWAAREGVAVLAWHEDRASGATPIEDRPGLMAALAALPAHEAGLLIVARRDRLARDPIACAMAERDAAKVGARIVSADGLANEDDDGAKMVRGILDCVYDHARKRSNANTRAALAARRARGEPLGKAPFGQRWENGALVDDPAEAAIIDRILDLRLAKHSLREIAERLNQEGTKPRRGQWSGTTIARVLARNTVQVAPDQFVVIAPSAAKDTRKKLGK